MKISLQNRSVISNFWQNIRGPAFVRDTVYIGGVPKLFVVWFFAVMGFVCG